MPAAKGVGSSCAGRVEMIGSSNWNRHKRLHEALMASHRKSLREEVREDVCTGEPRDPEVSLANTISNPVVTHIDAFGATDFDGVVGQAYSAAIVSEEFG